MTLAVRPFILLLGAVGVAMGQSSSLFVESEARRARELIASTQPAANGALRASAGAVMPSAPARNVHLARASLTAVTPPEPRVIKINDLLSVIVRHRLRYQTDTRLEQKSQWDLKAKLDAWFRIHDRKLEQQDFERGTPEVKFKNQNDLKNQGRADRRDIFEVRVQAKVIDVKPNGNLIIVAWSRVKIDDEDQFIRLTGECSKNDIGPDGSVLSDKVFGLDVETMNEGAMKDATKRGWLKEFVDGWKPF